MTGSRTPCLIGLLACVGIVAGFLLPYLIAHPLAVATYYEYAPVEMAVVALVALIAFGVLFGELIGVTSEPTVAGVLLVAGGFMLLNTFAWSLAVPPHLVMELTTPDEFVYHRGALVALTAIVVVVGVWDTARVIPG